MQVAVTPLPTVLHSVLEVLLVFVVKQHTEPLHLLLLAVAFELDSEVPCPGVVRFDSAWSPVVQKCVFMCVCCVSHVYV